MRVIRVVAFVLSFSMFVFAEAAKTAPPPAPAAAAAAASDTPNKLPVRRIVLYKNGVGYFEHLGRVRGSQTLSVDFTSAQLNDVLKSLTVVDLGEGRITGVRYDSTAPLSERMKSLRLAVGEDTTEAQFLAALRGARVEVRSGTTSALGRILSVESRSRETGKGETVETLELSIITDGGEMRVFTLGPGTSVRMAERELGEEVGRYLNLVGSSRSRDLRRMVISSEGTGERDVFVGYISEVPVWKSTYRVLLPTKPGATARLQGWAIVDNTIGEDWRDVQLTLVAGAAQSFIQDISRPFYARRPVVPLPQTAMLTPQSHQATMEGDRDRLEAMTAPAPAMPQMNGAIGGPVSGVAGIGSGIGGGVGGGVIGKLSQSQIAARSGKNEYRNFIAGSAAESVDVEARAADAALSDTAVAATAATLGDLFQYDIKQRITIGKNQSALVPIINAPIEADKVTLWSSADYGVPRRALWLKNTSDLTLDAGTFNVLEQNTFAGEGLIDAMKPGERRLISYAADTAVQVTSEGANAAEPVTRVRAAKGILTITRGQRMTTTYKVHNADTAEREVVLEHPLRPGWKLREGAKPEESSASFHRFRVKVDPKQTSELKVSEYHPILNTYALTTITGQQVAMLLEQRTIPAGLEDAFRRILAKKNEISALDEQIKTREQEMATISDDQGRVRENLKALKGSAEERALVQRYTRELNSQEDRLEALRKDLGDVRGKRVQAGAELDKMAQEVVFDEAM